MRWGRGGPGGSLKTWDEEKGCVYVGFSIVIGGGGGGGGGRKLGEGCFVGCVCVCAVFFASFSFPACYCTKMHNCIVFFYLLLGGGGGWKWEGGEERWLFVCLLSSSLFPRLRFSICCRSTSRKSLFSSPSPAVPPTTSFLLKEKKAGQQQKEKVRKKRTPPPPCRFAHPRHPRHRRHH